MYLGDDRVQVTWEYLKGWARDNKVPDEALIEVSGFAVKDLDQYEAEDGNPPLFTLIPGKRLYE